MNIAKHAAILIGAIALMSPVAASAQSAYPARPISVIGNIPPGGALDAVTRLFSDKVSGSLGQRVIVENKAGGNGLIATQYVKDANPDGYTLYLASSTMHVNAAATQKLPFDPFEDFTWIAALTTFPQVLAVPSNSPAKAPADIAQMAKSKAGGLNYGVLAIASGAHVASVEFQLATQQPMTAILYSQQAPLTIDVGEGRLDFAFSSLASFAGSVSGGKLRILGVVGPSRVAELPGVPTMAEAGFPKVTSTTWQGIGAPKNLPAPIVQRLQDEFLKAAKDPDLIKTLAGQTIIVLPTTGAEMKQRMIRETAEMKQVFQAAGVKVE